MPATSSSQLTWSISDLAREFDVTTRTIRYYEDMGLLRPERQGQRRIFHPADRTRLKLILRGKRLGLSLEESREIIDMYDPATGNQSQLNRLLARLEERRAHLLQQRKDLNAMIRDLDQAAQVCKDALVAQHDTDHTPEGASQ